MKLRISFALALLSFLTTIAQTTLVGEVTDQDGTPLEGASIRIEDSTLGTTTDYDGAYELSNLEDGLFRVEFSYLGFRTIKKRVNLTGGTVTLNVVLESNTEVLQDVEIVGRRNTDYKPDVTFAGTRTGADVKEIPQSIAIVNKEIIADQGLFRIEEITTNVAGVTKVRDADGFISRGFRLNHDYINGNRALIGTDFASSSIATQYERVEVIKGPAAALFGNSSPGGVVNAVTKKPLRESRASASLSYGSFDTKRATMDVTGPVNSDESLLYRVNFAWENADSFRDFQQFTTLMFAPSFSYIASEKTSFNVDLVGTFGTDVAGVDRGMPVLQEDLFALPISFNTAEPYDNRQNSSILLTISGSHKFSEKLSLNASYTRSDFNQNFIETRSANQFTLDRTELVRTINDRLTKGYSNFITAYLVGKFETGKMTHEGVVGFDYYDTFQDSRNRSAQGESNGVPNLSFSDRIVYDCMCDLFVNFSEVQTKFVDQGDYWGIYAQDLMTIGKFKILAGLRYEKLNQTPLIGDGIEITDDVDNDVLLPRLGVTFELNEKVNFFASYTESFQPQTIPVGINDIEEGETFDPLASDQIEIGTKSTFLDNRLLAQLSLYWINRNGRLIEDPGSGGGIIRLLQIGDETSRGIELDVTGRIADNFTLTANYAYNTVDVSDEEEVISDLELENNNPQHTAGLWAKYTISDGFLDNLGLALGGRYVSDSKIVDTTPGSINGEIVFPSYTTVNLAAFYKVKRFNFNLNVNNVFDERYFFGGLNAGRVFPGAPRNFLLTVGYSF